MCPHMDTEAPYTCLHIHAAYIHCLHIHVGYVQHTYTFTYALTPHTHMLTCTLRPHTYVLTYMCSIYTTQYTCLHIHPITCMIHAYIHKHACTVTHAQVLTHILLRCAM